MMVVEAKCNSFVHCVLYNFTVCWLHGKFTLGIGKVQRGEGPGGGICSVGNHSKL